MTVKMRMFSYEEMVAMFSPLGLISSDYVSTNGGILASVFQVSIGSGKMDCSLFDTKPSPGPLPPFS